MDDARWAEIRDIDWLAHRWAFEIRERRDCGRSLFEVRADDVGIVTLASRAESQAWIDDRRPCCLAELVARHPALHPAAATIESRGARRLARIRPELWGGYDALQIAYDGRILTLLSAKARAMFAGETAVFVRVRHAA